MFYSKSTKGFYDPAIHGENMPPDIVEVSDEQYNALFEAQSQGATISSDDNGSPISIPAIPTNPALIEIYELEASVTPRRVREAVLGADNGWLADINTKIAALRKKL